MKRTIEVIPSLILIMCLLISWYLKVNGGHWVNLFVIGLTGTCVYSLIIIFIDGLTCGFNSIGKKLSRGNKAFYTFMTVLWIISTTWAIYLMAHN